MCFQKLFYIIRVHQLSFNTIYYTVVGIEDIILNTVHSFINTTGVLRSLPIKQPNIMQEHVFVLYQLHKNALHKIRVECIVQ